MIEATQKKLREARFFFQHLSNESQKPVSNDPETFEFYLNAFLSAARSVTLALQYEEKAKYDRFSPWFRRLSPEDQQLLGFLKEQRNNAQHRGSPDVIVSSESVPINPLWTEHPAHPAYGFHLFGGELFGEAQIEVPVHLFQSSPGDHKVTLACERYLELLTRLVKDFLAQYGP
jgi:hypothetical protein